MDFKYKITVFWYQDKNEGYWVAQTAELPACPGIGDTCQEAITDLIKALNDVYEHSKELGISMPEPLSTEPVRFRPFTRPQRKLPYRPLSKRRPAHHGDSSS